jgi:hypothetical protein
MMTAEKATFHPKLYLFADDAGGHWSAIVGSPNFTNGALTGNSEAALFVHGEDQKDALYAQLHGAVAKFWNASVTIDKDRLREYAIQHRALAKARRALSSPPAIKASAIGAKHPRLLEYSFKEFAERVERDKYFEKRLGILASAREIFARRQTFSAMNGGERRVIAGLAESAPGLPGGVTDWKLFGSMSGMGDFANRVKDNDAHLSEALDAIPPTGEVTQAEYDQFVKAFRAAFKNSTRVGGVATASRLLAMKRPDWFVCVDSKNRKDLAADLGYSYSTLELDDYWEKVIVPVTQGAWWQTPRPASARKAIWGGHTAFLDSLYYPPSASK